MRVFIVSPDYFRVVIIRQAVGERAQIRRRKGRMQTICHLSVAFLQRNIEML
ncbi:hypothetical protein CV_0089 [Chromobacterium violaceum ATCC 12472]|uniref:Uncharacterized protein n=1 Tax=Chromobacterium violaceum (strain ATCC 12472 / DSM 30191 / JCM 1249 / CCUG 213 / NBRC 12614 / NCIMB 9131 / NCTC 9757 / MK) TaxID=243365 RepID=Q7P1X3_CHRVO|nr:hypothetical protein CV_0089 [Chromobacterium violaceum ATCC 12472]